VTGNPARGPIVFALLLTLLGFVLLLNNFLLLTDVNVYAFWPLLLVIAGVAVLVRGDLSIDDSSRTFGVTRGGVESASIEISSGEIDLRVRDLAREGRLIAGQFASSIRPALDVQETNAKIRLDRATTPWFNTADWELALARDLPWQLFVSTHLGQVDLDLDKLILTGGSISTGFGDIRVVCPQETLGPLHLHSAFGSIQVITPLGHKARIQIEKTRMFSIRTDERRYAQAEQGLYIARNADPTAPIVDIHISGTFGDVYLA